MIIKFKKPGPPGFTLIEFMVVVVIFGILAAVLAPRIPASLTKAKKGKTKGNLATLRSTLNIYYSDNDGLYPYDNLACLVPKYLKAIPDCALPPYHAASNTVTNGTVVGNSDAGNWQYNKNSSDIGWGNIWVECTHNDCAGTGWSSF
ncbi:MAG: prepilin-type N-terminal cleavage/methylation domain-containing protein [Elusimicrobiota bacterium]